MKVHKSGESSAVEILKRPELFRSLPKRNDFERLLCLWTIPSFEPFSSWSLYRLNKGMEYVVRRLEYDPKIVFADDIDDPSIYGAEAFIQIDIATKIIESFENINIPLFRRAPYYGIDGTSYGIIFGNYCQGTSVKWWSSPSDDWHALVEVYKSTTQLFENILPISTLRNK